MGGTGALKYSTGIPMINTHLNQMLNLNNNEVKNANESCKVALHTC